jgi:hypothetical protein
MLLDPVVDGLLQYRNERNPEKRVLILRRLAPYRDPRVAIVLMEAALDRSDLSVSAEATLGLYVHYVIRGDAIRGNAFHDSAQRELILDEVRVWWNRTEQDLRRRAKQLP